uniref:purine-nucleoside phosphorylase n=1 Tax=Schistocephalus solidus TaxID=70667 RepID=A0A0X3PY48_SCHSO
MPSSVKQHRATGMKEYESASTVSSFIRQYVHYRPQIAILCGTGFDAIADLISSPRILRFDDIPGFPNCEVIGQEGKFVFGKIAGKDVVMLQRRFQSSNTENNNTLSLPIRVAKLLGADYLIIMTVVAAVNPSYEVGDVMMVSDHVDFASISTRSPLICQSNSWYGADFEPAFDTYDRRLRDITRSSVNELNTPVCLHEGVYFHMATSSLCTPATTRMLQTVGCDAVGPKIIQEVLAANYLKLKTLAIGLVTYARNDYRRSPVEATKIARICFPKVSQLLEQVIQNI